MIYVWLSRGVPELAEKWKGFPPPENQLTGAIIAGPLLVIGCFWLGWTGEYSHISWYVPVLSTVLIGCGVNLMFASLLVGSLSLFVGLVLTPPTELPGKHVYVSFCPCALPPSSNVS